MEKMTINKPTKGCWSTMSTEETVRNPKLEFETGKPVTVTFLDDDPREYQSKEGDSVFYCFDITVDEEEKTIVTSAWTLLKGLKTIAPLSGKTVKIVKKIIKGKQLFDVEEVQD